MINNEFYILAATNIFIERKSMGGQPLKVEMRNARDVPDWTSEQRWREMCFQTEGSTKEDWDILFWLPRWKHFCIRWSIRRRQGKTGLWKTYEMQIRSVLTNTGILSVALKHYQTICLILHSYHLWERSTGLYSPFENGLGMRWQRGKKRKKEAQSQRE